jgi:hypothetical protein
MIEKPINNKTGKRDGILYTFGKSEVCIILAEILLNLPEDPKRKKFHSVSSKLTDYTNGLRTLAQIPVDASMRRTLCLDWRDKYFKIFDTLLTDNEGRTFLLNLVKTRYNEILGPPTKKKAKSPIETELDQDF